MKRIVLLCLCFLSSLSICDVFAQDRLEYLLSDMHSMRNTTYTQKGDSRRLTKKSYTGQRKSKFHLEIYKYLNVLEGEGVLTLQKDSIFIYGYQEKKGRIGEIIIKCSDGIFLMQSPNKESIPYLKFDTFGELLNSVRPDYDERQINTEYLLVNTAFIKNTDDFIKLLKKVRNPAILEQNKNFIWKIIVNDNVIISDELISYDAIIFSPDVYEWLADNKVEG